MKIFNLYQKLYRQYGAPKKFWPQWCADKKTRAIREIIILGAILTQRTSWRNAALALMNLKKNNLLSFKNISNLKSFDGLVELIRPAGFYQTKPRRIYELAYFITKETGGLKGLMDKETKIVRQKLLSLYGIGPETADVILLYALDKLSFVVDEYTKRFTKGNNLSDDLSYNHLKELFEENLPEDVKIYQNYHALIIAEQKKGIGIEMKKV